MLVVIISNSPGIIVIAYPLYITVFYIARANERHHILLNVLHVRVHNTSCTCFEGIEFLGGINIGGVHGAFSSSFPQSHMWGEVPGMWTCSFCTPQFGFEYLHLITVLAMFKNDVQYWG